MLWCFEIISTGHLHRIWKLASQNRIAVSVGDICLVVELYRLMMMIIIIIFYSRRGSQWQNKEKKNKKNLLCIACDKIKQIKLCQIVCYLSTYLASSLSIYQLFCLLSISIYPLIHLFLLGYMPGSVWSCVVISACIRKGFVRGNEMIELFSAVRPREWVSSWTIHRVGAERRSQNISWRRPPTFAGVGGARVYDVQLRILLQ